MKKVIINVTETHIDKGVQESEYNCPIAFAIKDALPEARSVRVDGRITFILCDQPCIFTQTPEQLDFMCAFDSFGSTAVEPFSFTLKLLDEV